MAPGLTSAWAVMDGRGTPAVGSCGRGAGGGALRAVDGDCISGGDMLLMPGSTDLRGAADLSIAVRARGRAGVLPRTLECRHRRRGAATPANACDTRPLARAQAALLSTYRRSQ